MGIEMKAKKSFEYRWVHLKSLLIYEVRHWYLISITNLIFISYILTFILPQWLISRNESIERKKLSWKYSRMVKTGQIFFRCWLKEILNLSRSYFFLVFLSPKFPLFLKSPWFIDAYFTSFKTKINSDQKRIRKR